jgi:hypothetical protein
MRLSAHVRPAGITAVAMVVAPSCNSNVTGTVETVSMEATKTPERM